MNDNPGTLSNSQECSIYILQYNFEKFLLVVAGGGQIYGYINPWTETMNG